MGDFNAKVGEKKEEKIVDPYGLGSRNNNGEMLIELCKEEGLMIAKTLGLNRDPKTGTLEWLLKKLQKIKLTIF